VRRSMFLNTWTARAGSILLATLLVGSCGLMETSSPVSRSLGICDWRCEATIHTPSGTIAMGASIAGLPPLAAWVVRDGVTTKTVLTDSEDVPDLLRLLAPWGDGAIIVATRNDGGITDTRDGEGLSWVTRDGKSWEGPTPFRAPGEGVFWLRPEFVWDARIIITGQQCVDDRWVNSIWTSTDAVTWHLAESPREGADFGWVRPGGDGLVVDLEVYALPSGSSIHQAWEWTTADLVHWRPLSSPYPCCEFFEPWGPRYGCEDGVLEP